MKSTDSRKVTNRIKAVEKIVKGCGVKHPEHGECSVTAVTKSAAFLTADDGTAHSDVPLSELTFLRSPEQQVVYRESAEDISEMDHWDEEDTRKAAERLFVFGRFFRLPLDLFAVLRQGNKPPKAETVVLFAYILNIAEMQCSGGGKRKRESDEKPRKWKGLWVPLGVERVQNSLGFNKRTQNRIIDRLIHTGFIFEQRHGMGSIRRRLKINYPKLNREMERVYEERAGIT